MPAEADILNIVGNVVDPVLNATLSKYKMVRSVSVEGDQATATIELPAHAYPAREALEKAIRDAVTTASPSIKQVVVNFEVVMKGKNAGANLGLKIKNIIAVGSGKGGVGKSTVSTSIAYGLQKWGSKVGLMDADVYGPSVPHMVGATGQPAIRQYQAGDGRTFERIEPIEANGLKVISMGFMVDPDQAVIWRGPMLVKALQQFVTQTDWGELDYLIIDMPPGTGDVALTLSQMVSVAGAVVVCTPQQVALLDAGKAISMFGTVKIPMLGMVENMTGEMFGRGGAKTKAEAMGIPFLGEVPSNPQIRISGDAGRMSDLVEDGSPVQQELLTIASNVAMRVAKSVLDTPSMPTLELL